MPRPTARLTARRLMLLEDLGRCKPPVTTGSYALETGYSAAYISQCVEVFVMLGLVKRQESPDDRRRCVLSLTPRGAKVVSANRGLVTAINQ